MISLTFVFSLLIINLGQIVHCKDFGRWFPYSPGSVDNNILEDFMFRNSKQRIKMGITNPDCDDGKKNLNKDWDESVFDYTCFWTYMVPDPSIQSVIEKDIIPKNYSAKHYCMDAEIDYVDPIPSFGPHRPLWAKYGEYQFLPKQRWIHNLEHGAVVMLYHPCADANEVVLLKSLVKNCLYRHVITPITDLQPLRPFALVTWGKRLLMSKVDKNLVLNFIMENALHGPEKTFKNGQFSERIIIPATVVSDQADTKVCSRFFS